MKTKHLVIAILVALMPTFLYAPKLIEAALATAVILDIKSVTATTYQVHKSGTRTAFTIDADYPCTTKTGRCACPRYGLVEENYIGGDGADLMPPIRALAGTRVAGWASATFSAEHCWLRNDFGTLFGYSALFALIALGYLWLKRRSR